MGSDLEASRLTLSLCMIVKNEEQHLDRCLTSAKPYVDEMVVVDTGSTDRTVAIATHHGARVEFFTWCDNFAVARNFAIDQTHGAWILMLDADEELVVDIEDWRNLLMQDADTLAYLIPWIEVNQFITPLQIPRLFLNSPELRYAGAYHEALQYRGSEINNKFVEHQPCIKILHHGNEYSHVLEKNLHRDIPMLERLRQAEGLNYLLLVTLAEGYLRLGQLDDAKGCWAEGWERIAPSLMSGTMPQDTLRLPTLMLGIGVDLLFDQQDYDSVTLICQRGLRWFPDYPPLGWLTGMLLRDMGLSLGATAYFETCLQMGREGTYTPYESFDQRYITVFPAYYLGLAYKDLNRLSAAAEAFRLTLHFDEHHVQAREELAQMS